MENYFRNEVTFLQLLTKKQMGIFITPLNQMVDTLKKPIFCVTPHYTKSGDFSLVKLIII